MVNFVTAATTTGSAPEGSTVQAARTPTVEQQSTGVSNSTSATANPSYVIDLGLNLVVLQFHDQHGDVIQSIPSERQLKAYREGGVAPAEVSAGAATSKASSSASLAAGVASSSAAGSRGVVAAEAAAKQ